MSIDAQSNNEQLELKIENDKLVLVDRYYTSGLFLTYRKDLEDSFVFKKENNNKLQLNITLGNETYTPTNLSSTDSRDFDRPYAGWFFIKTEIGKIKVNSAFFIAVETGITGEEALSGKIQTWAHNFFNIDVPTWTEEIESKFLVNLKAKYIWNTFFNKNHTFKYVVEPSLGTKDIYVSNNIEYTFGKLNTFNNSSRNNFIDRTNTNEFYGLISLGHRYVLHNTLIQGSLDYNDETFTTNNEPHVFEFKIGGSLKFKRNILKLIYNFNTRETPLSSSHSFGTLSFSRNF
nr:lipid A-modifier LpxR family protein [uncultured Winogradskyella sp.]